ncbi:hypothetical protein Tco_1068829 [Tanacetum coccineum]|uniref:Reverse transcriptase domain-containing protein n=1 Tax=Tanacetum coccineum TaxID=301880 RepID=A0ABQ5HIP6_9ASTR
MHNNVEDPIESAFNSKLLLINLKSQPLDKEKQEVRNIVEQATKRRTRITKSLKNFKVIHKESTIPLNKTPQISLVNAITYESYQLKNLMYSLNTLIDSSPKTDSLLEEFSGELAHIDPIPPGIEKADFDLEEEIHLVEILLYDIYLHERLKELNLECDTILEGDIRFLEELLSIDPLPLPKIESSNLDHFNDPSSPRPPPEPPDVEFSDELAHIDPIPPGIEEADFDLEEEIRLVENLSYDNSSPQPSEERNFENIDLFLASDDSMPSGIENDDYDSEGDICFLEELLSNDPLPLPEIESSNLDHFNEPSSPRPPPEPPDVEICFDVEPDTTMKNDFDELNEDGCFDSEGGEIDVFVNVEDDDYFPFTFIIRIFLSYLTYPEVSSFLLSSGSEDTIFDPGISTFHFSSLKLVAYENPIVIFLFFCFCPKDKGIRGESS